MKRRDFITALCANFIASPSIAQLVSSQSIVTDLDYAYRNDKYAQTAVYGPYEKSRKPYLIDFNRDDLGECYVYVSENVGSAKPIIFSHNLFGSPETYQILFEYLTTYGFAVIAPVHKDRELHSGDAKSVFEYQTNTSWSIDAVAENSILWKTRANNCISVLNELANISNSIKIAMDMRSPTIMGHGYGAFVAQGFDWNKNHAG